MPNRSPLYSTKWANLSQNAQGLITIGGLILASIAGLWALSGKVQTDCVSKACAKSIDSMGMAISRDQLRQDTAIVGMQHDVAHVADVIDRWDGVQGPIRPRGGKR